VTDLGARDISTSPGRPSAQPSPTALAAAASTLTPVTQYTTADDPALLVERARAGRLDALTLTSSEGVAHLLALPGVDMLKAVPVFVPHPRIAAAAEEGGFAQVVLTGPGDRGLIDGLAAHFAAGKPSAYPG
jgi:uroporphyrinogen-III synthase